jgi:hypothetical protein
VSGTEKRRPLGLGRWLLVDVEKEQVLDLCCDPVIVERISEGRTWTDGVFTSGPMSVDVEIHTVPVDGSHYTIWFPRGEVWPNCDDERLAEVVAWRDGKREFCEVVMRTTSRLADAALIAAAPTLITDLLGQVDILIQIARARHRQVKQYEAERDAERAARERAETENGRLRALTEGDPYSIYYEAAEMRSELMHLRRWKLEATEVIESWELVYEALGDVGGLGQRRSDAVLAEVLRMKAELDRAQLRSIEASNPGIDMDEVRRVRLAYPDPERHETVSRAKYGASLAADPDKNKENEHG